MHEKFDELISSYIIYLLVILAMSTLNQRLEKIIISIKVIAQLKKGQRLIFKPTGVSIQHYWAIITPFIRSVSMESRADAIAGLKQLFEEIERLIQDYSKSPDLLNPKVTDYDRDRAERIILSLNRLFNELPTLSNDPETGLNAAKTTYTDKAESAAELSGLIDNCARITREINLTIEYIRDRFGFDRINNKYTVEHKNKKNKDEETKRSKPSKAKLDVEDDLIATPKHKTSSSDDTYSSRKTRGRSESVDSDSGVKISNESKDDGSPV